MRSLHLPSITVVVARILCYAACSHHSTAHLSLTPRFAVSEQVPKKMNEEDIFPTFDVFGPLKDVAIIRDKVSGLHRGCAFVTFWNSSDAERAQEALHDKYTFPGGRKPAQVKPAEPSGNSKSSFECPTKNHFNLVLASSLAFLFSFG
jgi:RNA recognition motif-containing protein